MAISHSSIIVPFLLGTLLSLFIYQDLAATGVSFTTFSLFLGVSLSITAFPVLARILSDKNLTKTHLGEVALTCAAIDDVTAWCLLAIIVSLAQADVSSGLSTLAYTVIYIAAIFLILRPLLIKFSSYVEKKKNLSIVELALIFVGVLSSSLVTEVVGIHAIFGAFLFGAVIPHDGYLSHNLSNRLEELVRVLFLPAFFAFTGMKTEIGLLNSWGDWMICGLIILLAIIGKFGGTLIAAKFTGASWKESSALGILMNTRGLVELIVLNIGLELNILSPRLFAMLVIMALVTTFMTGPLLEIVLKKNPSK
jgi:Kef-type K+ transport system membrane component KefB